jgi:predicted enzyme related to lactoylglutathione lyase
MPRVVHFEIPAKDSAKIVAFYREVFGWEFSKWDQGDYWLVKTGEDGVPGINGGLYSPEQGMSGTVNTIDVPDLDSFVSKVRANGGQVVAPKMPVPGVGWLAYCRDVEGNAFGIMQADPNVRMPE